jgi:hypothetical protein
MLVLFLNLRVYGYGFKNKKKNNWDYILYSN